MALKQWMNSAHCKTWNLILPWLFILAIVLSLFIFHQSRVRLLAENKSLRQQAQQLLWLTEENKRLSDLLASKRESVSMDKTRMSELLGLRDEVDRLKKLMASATNQPAKFPPLRIEDAYVEDVIRLLGDVSGRIVLRPSTLPDVRITLYAIPTNSTETTLILEKALAEKGITSIPDGEKFLILMPSDRAASVVPRSAEVAVGDGTSMPANEGRDFIPLNNLATVYADLIGRKLIPNAQIPTEPVTTFVSSIPLTKAEVIYAVETILALNNVKVVPVGDNSIEVIVDPVGK